MSAHDLDVLDDPLNSFTIPQLKAVLEYHKVDVGKLRKKADIVNLCNESNINISEVPEHVATPRKSKSSRRSSTAFAFTTRSSEDDIPSSQRRSTVVGSLLAALDAENSPALHNNSSTLVTKKIEVIASTVEEQTSPQAAEEEVQPSPELDTDLKVANVFAENEEKEIEEQSADVEQSIEVEQSSETPVPSVRHEEVSKESAPEALSLCAAEATTEIVANAHVPESPKTTIDSPAKQQSDSSIFARMHELSTPSFGALCAAFVLGYGGLCYYLLSNPPAWADAGYPLIGLLIITITLITLSRYDEWFLRSFGPEHLIIHDTDTTEDEPSLLSSSSAANLPTSRPVDDFEVLRARALQLLTEQRTLLFQGIGSLEGQIRELTPNGQAPARSSSASRQLRDASRELAGMIHTLANVQTFFSTVATAKGDPEFAAILHAFASTA